MEKRIAPNNNLPATHYIEVWKGLSEKQHTERALPLYVMQDTIGGDGTVNYGITLFIFKIRENKLPTLYKF